MPTRTNASYADIAAALRAANTIALVSHIRPDADAAGSVLALGRCLSLMGKKALMILEDGVPENLMFLPGAGQIVRPGTEPLAGIDVAVALDTATHERIGEKCRRALSSAGSLINIDHHSTNPGYGDLNHIDVESPATGQILYNFITDQELPMDDAVRQNLFAAISTDTGSFQFACTTARSHQIAAEMIEAGLDIATLCRQLYHTFPKRRFELQKAMLNEMRFRAQDRIVSWMLTQETQKKSAMMSGDTEGLIDTLRTIDTAVAAVIFEELHDGKVRVSARSKDERLNVSAVCAQFGGGGHAMAAGARMKGPLGEAAEQFLKALENELGRLA